MRRYWNLARFAALALAMAFAAGGCSVDSGNVPGNASADLVNASGIGLDNSYSVSENPADPENISGQVSVNLETSRQYLRKGDLLECNYYDEISFRKFDEISDPYETSGELFAGVVTHHMLAGRMISSFFRTAAGRKDIETVVIIAPMHYPNEAGGDICTTLKGWQTPFGEVMCDKDIAGRFISELGAGENDEMLAFDHSASTFLPFISYYLPGAKVSCLLISGRADRHIPEETASLLYEISCEKKCLFIFSADFAHYLTPEQTEEKDRESLAAIMSGDTASIEIMGDDHMDTPRCICTFIRLAGLAGCSIEELDHSESSRESGLPFNRGDFPEGVTSYFILGGIRETNN